MNKIIVFENEKCIITFNKENFALPYTLKSKATGKCRFPATEKAYKYLVDRYYS